MRSLDEFALGKLAELERQGLRRNLVETVRLEGIWAERGGKRLLSFSCNDYLNLSQHPALKAAAIAATKRFGVGAGASRLVTGNHPLLSELERRLARLKGTEACCVFGSGYLANVGIIPALAGLEDLVLIDELSHACIFAGATLTRGKIVTYRHCDVADAAALLTKHRQHHERALLVTDGVFSMDGDIAPLDALSALARRHDAWLLVDDAHGLGVLGGGRGSAFIEAAPTDVPLQMGTLSKAVGAYGGYLCASRPVVELMHNRARTLIYSTAMPAPIAAACITALDIIEGEPEYAAQPLAKARTFTRAAGLPPAQSPIVPVVLGSTAAAMNAAKLLLAEGFLVIPIRPPTVPEGTARLRFAFTAIHPDEEIQRLAKIVRERILAVARP